MHYLIKVKYKLLIFISLLITILINLIDYLGIIKSTSNDYSLIYRGIDSNFKFLFFGVFGLFFNLKISIFSFLFIPIVIYYLFNFFNFKRHTKLFILTLFIIFSLIMSKGFFNYRYITTLLPLVLVIILLEYQNAYPKLFKVKYLSYLIVSILTITFLSVLFIFLDTNTLNKPGNQYKTKQEWVQIGLPRYVKSQFTESENIVLFYSKLDSILINSQKNILINNIPEYYLKCKSKGIYYWCGDDIIYLEKSNAKLLSNNSTELANFDIIKRLKALNVDYILSYKEYNNYSPSFNKFIQSSTEIILEVGDLTLYKIKSD
jgi:hypothetical protein